MLTRRADGPSPDWQTAMPDGYSADGATMTAEGPMVLRQAVLDALSTTGSACSKTRPWKVRCTARALRRS